MSSVSAPDVELLIATNCAHCRVVLSAFSDLLKQGRIGRLEITNIAVRPEFATMRGARSVPWMRIGPFELSGTYTPSELAAWVERAGNESGWNDYLSELLATGELETATAASKLDPAPREALLALAADLETPYAVRIGIGAIFEELGPEGLLADLVDQIVDRLVASDHAQVRADAAHFLGLSGSIEAFEPLQRLRDDTDAEVREIAQESLELLGA
ncbi:MAG: HEAT repeat domain-containing protein [Gammaproteobacteria bacterium]|nr:HEAT repeat domain-containing protein [Gammaproteobacteria bacterium]